MYDSFNYPRSLTGDMKKRRLGKPVTFQWIRNPMSLYPCPSCRADRLGLEQPCETCDWRPDSSRAAGEQAPMPAAFTAPTRFASFWWGYFIAPPVASVLMAIAAFTLGMTYLVTHPDDAGTPVGVIMLPILLVVVGTAIAYTAAGLIGMPIIVLLDKQKRLSFLTICSAGLACLILPLTVVTGLTYALVTPRQPVVQHLGVAAMVFASAAPFVLASATTFWWIVVRGLRGFSLQAIFCSQLLLRFCWGR